MNLQAFLSHYRSLLERAINTGFKPASDLSEDLIRLCQLPKETHATLIGKMRANETDLGRKMTDDERHQFIFSHLNQVAESLELMRFERGETRSEKVNSVKDKKIKKAKKKKFKKGKKTANAAKQADANADPKAKPPAPAKKGRGDPNAKPPAPAPAAQSEDKLANAIALLADAASGNWKGKGKGKGKGKSGSSNWSGGGKGYGAWRNGKGKGKGKGKSKGTYDSSQPSALPPPGYNADVDWRCGSCKAFNFKSRTHCFHCNEPK